MKIEEKRRTRLHTLIVKKVKNCPACRQNYEYLEVRRVFSMESGKTSPQSNCIDPPPNERVIEVKCRNCHHLMYFSFAELNEIAQTDGDVVDDV